jgi:uncharacterized membrane protein YccC
MDNQKVGAWAFILGVVIAIIAGLASTYVVAFSPYVLLVLVILGLILGFLNIRDKEVTGFLIAAIALMAVGTANLSSINLIVPTLGTLVNSIVQNIAVVVAPAALVVALKEVYNIARE